MAEYGTQFLQHLNTAGFASGFHPMQLQSLQTNSGIRGGFDSLWTLLNAKARESEPIPSEQLE